MKPESRSKVITMGNIVEVITMERVPNPPPTVRIDKDHYWDIRFGEDIILDYNHGTNKSDNLQSVRRTMARIRALINTNVTDLDKVRWMTLTYKENMTDPAQLYRDYKNFWLRFRRWSERNGIDIPEYIAIAEPQSRGAWHLHCVLIWDKPAPFLSNNDVIAPMWGHGFTNTRALKKGSVDNLGAYVTAYLSDMPFDEVEELTTEERFQVANQSANWVHEKPDNVDKEQAKSKRFIKGARLVMYPPGMNIIRHSSGIREPVVELMPHEKASEKVSGATLTFSTSFSITDGEDTINTLRKDYYNRAPRRGQVKQTT